MVCEVRMIVQNEEFVDFGKFFFGGDLTCGDGILQQCSFMFSGMGHTLFCIGKEYASPEA